VGILRKIGFVLAAMLFIQYGFAYPFAPADTTGPTNEATKALIKRIDFEKERIGTDYHAADSRFFNLVDSVREFIMHQPVSAERKNIYLSRLQMFLSNISRYYSDSYFRSGTYQAALGYYPLMIEWDQQDELLHNLERYSSFSIKATKLIPNDTVAEDFLTDYMTDNPDDFFRYAEEFDDRKFVMRILEKAVKLAPESAKRYYANSTTVGDLLRRSRDVYARKSVEIYNKFGIKSRAYLLLDAIVKERMPVEVADSLTANQAHLFSMLVQQAGKYDNQINYSAYRYLDLYAIEALRKANQTIGVDQFKSYSPDELFVLITYGYKETTFKNFQSLVELLHKKADPIPITATLVTSMNKEKLRDLVIYCDGNQLLDNLLSLVEDDKKNYLLSLATLEERENLAPPLRAFTREDKIAQRSTTTKNINGEIIKPIKQVANEVVVQKNDADDAPLPVQSPIAEKQVQTNVQPVTANQATAQPVPEPVKAEKKELADAALPVQPRPVSEIITATPATATSVASVNATTANPITPVAVNSKKEVLPIPSIPVDPIKIVLDERTKTIIALKKNIVQTIQNIPAIINKDYAEEVLLYAAQKEPDELFKKIDAFKTKYFCIRVLETCALNAPVSLKRYLYNPRHPVNYILQYTKNPQVKKIFEVNAQIGYHSKPLVLIDDILNGSLSEKDAVLISADPNKLFSAVVKIISRDKYLGKYSIDHEMRDYSLRFIREINDKIASGAPQPFSSVEGFSSTDLYFLMLYGRDEVFTSTFNGLFNRFMQKLPNSDGDMFLHTVNYNQFRKFISLCSNFGTIEDFLTKFSPEAKKSLLASYVSNLETEKDDLSTIVLVAEAISNTNDQELRATLQSNLKREYERVKAANNQVGLSIYGVLSSMVSGNATTEANWYHSVAQQFRISPVTELQSASLFSQGANCIEQMYFYDDDDGRSSFLNFMHTYKNQSAWGVEDRNSFVRIYSRTGAPVEIFANKPEFEVNGINAIATYFVERSLAPTVIVHRGHSFHTEATLEKVTPSAKLIFVGSCGGFYKISVALENAPEAQIISTKQVGTKTINDAMLYALNENIRSGKDIEWNEFWDKMRDKLGNNQYFGDYVPPHKNLEAIFIKAYYKTLGV
jgi:hypothetical protein